MYVYVYIVWVDTSQPDSCPEGMSFYNASSEEDCKNSFIATGLLGEASLFISTGTNISKAVCHGNGNDTGIYLVYVPGGRITPSAGSSDYPLCGRIGGSHCKNGGTCEDNFNSHSCTYVLLLDYIHTHIFRTPLPLDVVHFLSNLLAFCFSVLHVSIIR